MDPARTRTHIHELSYRQHSIDVAMGQCVLVCVHSKRLKFEREKMDKMKLNPRKLNQTNFIHSLNSSQIAIARRPCHHHRNRCDTIPPPMFINFIAYEIVSSMRKSESHSKQFK